MPSHFNPVHANSSYLFKIYFNIILSYTCKRSIFVRITHQYPACMSLRPPACHMPRPSHPPSFDHSDNVSLRQITLSMSISISLTYTKTCFAVHSTVIKGNYFSFLKKFSWNYNVAANNWVGKNLAGEWRAVGNGVSWKQCSLFHPRTACFVLGSNSDKLCEKQK